ETEEIAAVELAPFALAQPEDVLGEHLSGPGGLGAVAQIGAEAGAGGGGEVVRLPRAGDQQALHVGEVVQAGPGSDAHRPQPVAGRVQLALELLLPRFGAQLGTSRRRIRKELGSRTLRPQAEGQQAEDRHRSSPFEANIETHDLPPVGRPVSCEGSAVERARVGVMIRHSARLLAALLALILLWAPLPFGGVTPWAGALLEGLVFGALALAALALERPRALRPAALPAAALAALALLALVQAAPLPAGLV